MRLKKAVLLLMLPFAADLLEGCPSRCETTTYVYTNCNIQTFNIDNSGKEIVLSMTDSIKKEAYGIRAHMDRSTTTCKASSFHWGSTQVFAECFARLGYYEAKDSIMNVQVRTLLPFDAQHAAGTDITEYFSFYEEHFFYEKTEFLESTHRQHNNLGLDINLLLMTPPPQAGNHQFEISIQLTDGRMLVDTTKAAVLL